MRRSLISVAGANSRAGKAQISVAGDLLASQNSVNLQQKVNKSQRGAAFAFDEMAKANSTESMDCHASRGALARNDGVEGVLVARNDGLPCHSEPALVGEESTNGKKSVNSQMDSSLRATHSAQNDKWGAKSVNFGAQSLATNTLPQSRCAREVAFSRFRVNFGLPRLDFVKSRNDEFGVNFTQNSHENSQNSVNFTQNSQKSPQKRAQSTKTPPAVVLVPLG